MKSNIDIITKKDNHTEEKKDIIVKMIKDSIGDLSNNIGAI